MLVANIGDRGGKEGRNGCLVKSYGSGGVYGDVGTAVTLEVVCVGCEA